MIIWKHTSAIVCDPAITIADVFISHLRSIAIVRSYGNQSFAIRDRNTSHNISSSLPRFNARVFDCWNGRRYECVYYHSRKDFNGKSKKASYWDKIGQKIHLSAEEAEAKFLQHKNCIRSVSNPKPIDVFDGFGAGQHSLNHDKQQQNFRSSTFAMLFALQPTRTRVYLTFSLTKTYACGRLCDRCDYMETAFFAIVCDCLRSTIVCDHMETSL